MPGLRELQTTFSENLFDENASSVQTSIYAGDFNTGQRMQIYRNNIITSFTDALRAVYPVVERLVGHGFFLYAANDYIINFPSTEGNLHNYGHRFPSFLKSFEAAQELEYLPDVALLEWHYHEVYHEQDSAPLNFHALSMVDPEQYDSLRFELSPSCRLMQSAYPILEIWRVNQDTYAGEQNVDLRSGGIKVLILRDSRKEIALHPLGAADYQMLSEISQRRRLNDCLNAALAVDGKFELNEFLQQYVTNMTLVDFDLG